MLNSIDNGDKSIILAPAALVGGALFVQGSMIGVVGDNCLAGDDVAIIHRQEMEYSVAVAANTNYAVGTPIYQVANPAAGAPTITVTNTGGLVQVGFVSRAFATGAGVTSAVARVQIRG